MAYKQFVCVICDRSINEATFIKEEKVEELQEIYNLFDKKMSETVIKKRLHEQPKNKANNPNVNKSTIKHQASDSLITMKEISQTKEQQLEMEQMEREYILKTLKESIKKEKKYRFRANIWSYAWMVIACVSIAYSGLLFILSIIFACVGWRCGVVCDPHIGQLEYDFDVASRSIQEYHELLHARKIETEARIEVEKSKAREYEMKRLKCPVCGSTDTQKISTLNRFVSVGVFGLASSKIGKQYECKKCKHKW